MEENVKIYYNACFNNCQHFACYIEKILFNKIQNWHSFDFYLECFFNHFFSYININPLKIRIDEEIKIENKEIYNKNLIILNEFEQKMKLIVKNYHQ